MDCYNRSVRLLPLLAALLLSGCDTYHYLAGTIHEDARRPQKALPHYEAFVAKRPKDVRACEIRLRAAALYRRFERCAEARVHYEAVARDFASVPECAERGQAGLLACPDYFPLDPGRSWVYVDSDSKGRAMRQEFAVRRSSGAGAVLQGALFAGDKRIRSYEERYEKRDWALWRVEGKQADPVLRYPFNVGQSWTARREKARLSYVIEASGLEVTTVAGTFKGVLKVRETDSRFPRTWRYDYYAPGVGRVKTTIGGKGYENPNAELSRYDGGMVK